MFPTNLYFKLNEDKAFSPCNMMEANMQWGKNSIVRTEIGSIHISTIFLPLNHAWDEGPPILFETMVFGLKSEEYESQWRYYTYQEAADGHNKIVRWVKIRLATQAKKYSRMGRIAYLGLFLLFLATMIIVGVMLYCYIRNSL